MKIQILEAARTDLIEGHSFYEGQQQGLGSYFLDTLYSDIESLHLYAGIHPQHAGNYQRLLSDRFPFAVYYRVTESTIEIHGVLDCRRSPAWIKKRLT